MARPKGNPQANSLALAQVLSGREGPAERCQPDAGATSRAVVEPLNYVSSGPEIGRTPLPCAGALPTDAAKGGGAGPASPAHRALHGLPTGRRSWTSPTAGSCSAECADARTEAPPLAKGPGPSRPRRRGPPGQELGGDLRRVSWTDRVEWSDAHAALACRVNSDGRCVHRHTGLVQHADRHVVPEHRLPNVFWGLRASASLRYGIARTGLVRYPDASRRARGSGSELPRRSALVLC